MSIPIRTGDHELFLIISSATDLRNRNIELIRDVTAKGYYVLVITTNQISEVLRRNYEKNGIPLDRIWFVDAVTRYALGHDPGPVKQCRFVNNPSDLTDIGIAVSGTLKELQGKEVCLLLDSVNSMLIYLSSQNIKKFVHFITSKLRLLNFSGIFLAVEKGLDPDVLIQLTTFVDEVIDMDKEPGA